MRFLAVLTGLLLVAACEKPKPADPTPPKTDPKPAPDAGKAPSKSDWQDLFDGKTLGDWKPVEFGGEGEVHVEDGNLILPMGAIMTGVVWKGRELPKVDYELQVTGARMEGTDFWGGITFPVRDSHCSLILGGWGGGLTGLSSIDDMDASENEYSGHQDFEKKKFYTVRIRVTAKAIVVWLGKEQIIEADIDGRKVGVRIEMEESIPMGISTYQTTSAIREIKLRRIPKP